jgi:hypothetical protein
MSRDDDVHATYMIAASIGILILWLGFLALVLPQFQ